MTTPTRLTALSDPGNVLFEVAEESVGLTDDEAYAFLVGADRSTSTLPPIVVAAADVQTGAMIALVPTDADAERLALDDFEAPDQLHLTLVYLGEAADISPESRAKIIDVVRRHAGASITAQAFAVNIFNPTGDEPALVLGVGNDGGPLLEELRSDVYEAIQELAEFDVPGNHTPWIPHVTLAYSEHPGELIDQATKRVGPITFDRVRVAFGGENTDIQLEDDTVVATGGDTMPWDVRKRGEKYCVVKTSSGETVACHDSQDKAQSQLKALYANTDYGLQLAIQDFNLEFEQERDVNAPGGGHNLKEHWVHGPGAAKIRWGTDGSFDRCVRHLGKYVRDPQGLCAEYHHAATGEWPRGGIPSAGGTEEFDVTDAHGHRHGRDGKFTGKSGGDIDKLKTLVGKQPEYDVNSKTKPTSTRKFPDLNKINPEGSPEYERAISQRKSNGYDEDDVDKDERNGRYSGALIEMTTDAAKDETECGPGQHRAADGTCVDDESADMDTYANGDGSGDEPWSGVLSVEGIESGDGRLFALGSLDWEQPPQPLMYQPANTGGHSGSIMVGNIQKITRHGSRIRGKGTVFGSALAGQHGEDIRHMMTTGGVSVDVDQVKDADVEMIYADDTDVMAKPETTIFHRGRIRGATLVAFPAFVEAKLAFDNAETLTASTTEDCDCDSRPMIAASHIIEIPNVPPAEWFNEPTDVELSGALTITDEGRVYGILAPGNTHHRVMRNRTVPLGNVDYTRFHKGETIVAGGGRVVTGVITADCGHAATENYGTLQNRIDHYDNSCSVLANVRLGESKKGYVWVAGALNPGAQPHQVAQAFGCALSGDWQPHADRPGLRDFIAAHIVPVPGFPMARTQASVQFEDGLITASSVPVRYVSSDSGKPTTASVQFDVVANWKQALAVGMGRDPGTRKRELAAELREN